MVYDWGTAQMPLMPAVPALPSRGAKRWPISIATTSNSLRTITPVYHPRRAPRSELDCQRYLVQCAISSSTTQSWRPFPWSRTCAPVFLRRRPDGFPVIQDQLRIRHCKSPGLDKPFGHPSPRGPRSWPNTIFPALGISLLHIFSTSIDNLRLHGHCHVVLQPRPRPVHAPFCSRSTPSSW